MVKKQPLLFLADESLEYRIVLHLREMGYDVVAIAEDSPSISDKQVLENAYSENRIVITNDKDFGDLVFINNLPHKGIILLRFKNEETQNKIKIIESVFKDFYNKLIGHFVVIDENKIRIR